MFLRYEVHKMKRIDEISVKICARACNEKNEHAIFNNNDCENNVY